MTATKTRPDLDSLDLDLGGHSNRESGVCLMEAVAWFAGEEHSESPQCASGVLTKMGITLNDGLPEKKRQQLKQYIPHIIGTRDDGLDKERGLRCANWLLGFARTCTVGRHLNPVAEFIKGLPAWVTAEELYPNIAAQLDALGRQEWRSGDGEVGATVWQSVLYGFEVSGLLTPPARNLLVGGLETVIRGPSDWTSHEIADVQDNIISFYGELVMLGKT